jgi:hemophore-related protein
MERNRISSGGLRAAAVVGAAATGLALAAVAAPQAGAEPCRADAATATISQVSGAVSGYLAGHPGANDALSAAITQQPAQARDSLRAYFMANPGEYFDLRNITQPLSALRAQCGTSFLTPDVISAFDEFQAG